MNDITDSDRLDYVEDLFRNCPHVEIGFNGDTDVDEPIGWRIRVSGCETSEEEAPTFRGVIDAAIEKARKEGWR